jgi:hypothetical protein
LAYCATPLRPSGTRLRNWMADVNSAPKRYSYRLLPRLIPYGMPSLAVFCLSVAIVFLAMRNLSGTIYLLMGGWFLALSFYDLFACSALLVSDAGIAAYKFHLRMKFIPWSTATRIEKRRTWNM